MKKKAIFIICLLLMMAITIYLQETEFPKLTGPYLGQKPPGMTPEIFGKGLIDNDKRIFAITFSPDGKECFYTKSFKTNTIMTTREVNGKWEKPKIAEFSGYYFDFEPHITFDGKKLIFGSKRPLPGEKSSKGLFQWTLEKTKSGWSNLKPLGSPFEDGMCMFVSVAKNFNLYFTGKDGIYVSKFIDGIYTTPQKLDKNINHLQWAAHPCIAPDESYLIFDAQPTEGNADLFISFREKSGSWGKAIKFGSDFNTDKGDLAPFVSHDGKYLFFSRAWPGNGDIYWVDARIIEALKPKELK